MSEREPCKCHGSWPLHADDQAADLRKLRAHVEALEGALGYLLKQIDEVERSSVIRESDTYRRARAALAGETEEVRHG